jgi:hypothetical protein
MNNTINIKELRQRLPELQIAWLQMDRGHQEWGNCAKSYRESMNGKKFVTLEMRNENFGINIYLNNVGVEVRSVTEKSDSIAVQLWFEDAPLDPDDLYNLLMTEAKKQCRGKQNPAAAPISAGSVLEGVDAGGHQGARTGRNPSHLQL